MTNGIIQQVINRYIDRFSKGYYNERYYDNAAIIELKDLQQELIENIKQNINKGFRCACVDTDEIIQLLIGDNQE